ncbi:unnamed protein product [Clavelina lepadiformis]|uniref:CCHC-type domain-containing protein n=1 Tax=Clavelina lepadiformis TaxID=159417 RepID=A0ABP0GI33_CLALP
MTSEVAAVTGDHQDVSQLKRTVEKLQDEISQLRNEMKTAREPREERRRLQCFNCGEYGHVARRCHRQRARNLRRASDVHGTHSIPPREMYQVDPTSWDDAPSSVRATYNSSVHEEIGVSPHYMRFLMKKRYDKKASDDQYKEEGVSENEGQISRSTDPTNNRHQFRGCCSPEPEITSTYQLRPGVYIVPENIQNPVQNNSLVSDDVLHSPNRPQRIKRRPCFYPDVER